MKRKISLWIEPIFGSGDYEQVELFQDEQITVNSSIQNIFDISKVFTDYSQSFTVPASTINNAIFKHFYQSDVGDVLTGNSLINHNTNRNAYIEIDLTFFRRGKIRLEKSNIKNGYVDNYQIGFFGELKSLKDKFGEDKLNLLELKDFTFPYDGTEVLIRILDSSDYDVRFPLIANTRLWTYNDNGPNDITKNAHKIQFTELFPAIKVVRLFELIASKYGVQFNGAIFEDDRFNNLYLQCKNSNEFLFQTIANDLDFIQKNTFNDPSWSTLSNLNAEDFVDLDTNTINVKNFNDNIINHLIEIQINIISAPGNLIIDVYQDNNHYQTFTTTITGPPLFNINIQNTSGLNTNFTFKLRATAAMNVDCQINYQIQGFISVNNFTNSIAIIQTVQTGILGNINLNAYVPDMKISDFFAGVLKEFNCTCVSTEQNKYEILPLDDWYSQGALVDITEYTDINSIDIETIKLYKKIAFKYQESESFTNKNYFATNGLHYGNVEYQFDYDGEEYIVESPFENLLFTRTTDPSGDYAILGYFLNANYESYVPKPCLLYQYGISDSLVHDIAFNDGVATQSISEYMLFGQDYTHNNTKFSLNFGADNSIIHNETIQYGLYATYYFPYLSNLYNLKNRIVYVKTILPVSLLTNLQLNDRIIIRDKRYIINEMKSNLTTGEVDFVLYLDFRSVIGGVINGNKPYELDGQAQCIKVSINLPHGASQCDLTCATAGVTITPSTITASQAVEICVPVTPTPMENIVAENDDFLIGEEYFDVISEAYEVNIINVQALYTFLDSSQAVELIILQI